MKKPLDISAISWIYLAISIASENEPVDFFGISMIADGINHVVPTSKELQTSISWLLEKGLVDKVGNKYTLTQKGKEGYRVASEGRRTLLKICDNMREQIQDYV